MNAYLVLKTVHVISAAILFGTGFGIAFFMWFTHRSGDIAAIARTARLTVLADAFFTAPAIVIQPVSGFLMLYISGVDWHAPWVLAALALYAVAGACWIPVVILQRRIRDLAAAAARCETPLPLAYHRAMKTWFALGWPAFASVLAIYWLMIAKPSF